MKSQALILLGLLCVSTLAQVTITNPLTITLSGVTYGFGKVGNNCGVSRTPTGQTGTEHLYTAGLAATDDCVPKGIVSVGTDVWIVAQISANADILTNANSQANDDSLYNDVIPVGSEVAGTVVIGKIVTAATDFGKFLHATQFASQATGPVWGAFTVSEVLTCSTAIQLKGNTASATHFVVNQAGTPSTVSGNNVFVDFDTTNNDFDGETATTKTCPSITASETVEVSDVTYGIGKDGNNCGVTREEDGQNELQYLWTSALAAADDCEPKAIINIGSNIWIVAQVSADGDLLADANSVSTTGSEYEEVIPAGSEVDGTVVIGRIVITNAAASFGRFNYATQFATKTAANAWGSFEIAEVTTCSNTIQLKGDTQSAEHFVVDQDGDVSTVSGDEVFVGFNTENQDFGGFTDSDKPCSGVILSIASAIVSLVAMFF